MSHCSSYCCYPYFIGEKNINLYYLGYSNLQFTLLFCHNFYAEARSWRSRIDREHGMTTGIVESDKELGIRWWLRLAQTQQVLGSWANYSPSSSLTFLICLLGIIATPMLQHFGKIQWNNVHKALRTGLGICKTQKCGLLFGLCCRNKLKDKI